MLKTKQVTVQTTKVEDVICNKCGASCLKSCGYDSVSVQYTGGYDSSILGDMCRYEFELCEACLAAFMASFKHSALVDDA